MYQKLALLCGQIEKLCIGYYGSLLRDTKSSEWVLKCLCSYKNWDDSRHSSMLLVYVVFLI